jgi:hypothetical protein
MELRGIVECGYFVDKSHRCEMAACINRNLYYRLMSWANRYLSRQGGRALEEHEYMHGWFMLGPHTAYEIAYPSQ